MAFESKVVCPAHAAPAEQSVPAQTFAFERASAVHLRHAIVPIFAVRHDVSFQLDDTGFDALITEGDSRKARFIPDRRIGGTDHFPLRYIGATLLCGS
jgi:hypothetical protein